MFGPAIGGWIIAAFGGSAGPAFFFDAATFAISVGCLLAVGRHPDRLDVDDSGSIGHEIAEGLRYVRTRVWLWGTFLAATLAYLIFWVPAEVLLRTSSRRRWAVPPASSAWCSRSAASARCSPRCTWRTETSRGGT